MHKVHSLHGILPGGSGESELSRSETGRTRRRASPLEERRIFDEALKYCLNCKRCEVACPSNVKIGDIIQSARIKYSKHRPSLRDKLLANTDFMGTFATMVAPVTNFALGLKPVKMVMDSVLKIDGHRTFPKYSGQKFETWFQRNAEARQGMRLRSISPSSMVAMSTTTIRNSARISWL